MTLARGALTEAVKDRALALGFDRVAVGSADPPDHGSAFVAWLEAGYAGTMDYMERGRAKRLDPRRVLPGARSVVAVALNYHQGEPPEGDTWAPVARYARGRDYHDVMTPRLEALLAFLRDAAGPEVRGKVYVDTGPVLERGLAARAGLGWVGKNTNLLHPDLGSWFFLGILLTTADLEWDGPLPDRCGTCRACLDACPTQAFLAPYVLDARRCISYLTIEHRGPIPGQFREAMGEWVFGCDLCQTVCPWNRKAPLTREPGFLPATPLPPLASLLEMSEAQFRRRFGGTPLTRPKRRGLARNAAVVLGNRKDPEAIPALTRALSDSESLVRDHAAWALSRIAADEVLSHAGDH
ncbi:MAG: tRNA epoxyqueuosine(34) reductase QueG [Candidatus Rokubacteria bacterium]|nr:tRNA epoxyqueuosine(34) reductase QueG [Candidatus Rokubacteria bacterium]